MDNLKFIVMAPWYGKILGLYSQNFIFFITFKLG
jgi:hypothetical protein